MKFLPAVALVVATSCITDTNSAGTGDSFETTDTTDCPFLVADPVSSPTISPEYSKKNVPIFDENVIVEFRLTFSASAWKEFEDGMWKNPKYNVAGQPEEIKQQVLTDWEANNGDYYVHCGFEFDGEVFEDAACRPRGSPEGWHKESKPQIKIRFDKWDKNGRFRGLRSVNLEYLRNRDAPVRDRLAMWFMRESGLPASRVNHVRLRVKKGDAAEEDFGLYMNIEPVDREFLEDRFKDPSGNLYKGGWIKKTNKKEKNDCDIWTLNDLVYYETQRPADADHSEFFEALARAMDVDQVLRVMAAEVLLQTKDNLSNGSTNFYFYNNPGENFVAIPWDLDVVLAEQHCDADTNLFETVEGEPCSEAGDFRRMMMLNPEWKQRFEEHLVDLRDNAFSRLVERTKTVCAQIRDGYSKDAAWLVDHDMAEFDADCLAIEQRVVDRIAYVKQVLGR
ncbi:MAG: hypothetical protein GXP54_08650 [Deltaproteobacteria bacterium]|nr:hypothetical protein [Deltaproteobacteria bacterium]